MFIVIKYSVQTKLHFWDELMTEEWCSSQRQIGLDITHQVLNSGVFLFLDWLSFQGKRYQCALLFIHSWKKKKKLIKAFPKGISMKWSLMNAPTQHMVLLDTRKKKGVIYNVCDRGLLDLQTHTHTHTHTHIYIYIYINVYI